MKAMEFLAKLFLRACLCLAALVFLPFALSAPGARRSL